MQCLCPTTHREGLPLLQLQSMYYAPPIHLSAKRSLQYAFLGFLFVFEIGSLLCAVATSSSMLIIGRAIAGLGSSGLFNGGLTIVGAILPVGKRPIYMGMLMACEFSAGRMITGTDQFASCATGHFIGPFAWWSTHSGMQAPPPPHDQRSVLIVLVYNLAMVYVALFINSIFPHTNHSSQAFISTFPVEP